MSKTDMIESDSTWVEEDLIKLSFKELKKLAKENSIKTNSNTRKADLVKALLNSSTVNISLIDKSDIMETDTRVRMTRSRASMFQPLCAMQDELSTSNKISDTTDEKEQFDKEMESSNKIKRKNKSKIKSEIKIDIQTKELVSSNPTEIFNIVSSIQKNSSRPLTEITNNDVLSKRESEQINCTDNKNLSKPKRRKGKALIKSLSTETLNVESKTECETQCFKNESDEIKKEEINSSITMTFDDRKTVKKSKGKGKKAKIADESVTKEVESSVEEPSTNNQSENVDAENKTSLEITYREDNEKELNNVPITIADNKKPRKKTGGRGKKAKEQERNLESEEICSNVTTELSIDCRTEERLTHDNSPVEDKRRKRNRNKSNEMENSAQNTNSSVLPKDGQCEPKKQRLRKTSKENYDRSVKKEEPVLAESLKVPESKDKSLTSETQSSSIMSDITEIPSTSNSRRNIKNAECKSNNSKLRVDSSQNTNLTETMDSNKSSTDKTPDITKMPVRTSNVSSVTTDSAGTSRKTRSSQNMSKFEPPLRSSTFVIEEGAGGQTPRSSLSKNQADDLPSCSKTFLVEEEALETKSTPVQLAQKVEKSIGARILSVSMKKGNIKPLVKQATGSSTVTKSSITKAKHSNTPGSVYKTKFGVAKKPPNFKSLHKKLFQNMESIDENKQRTMARAQALISSPAVPRCALLSPKPEVAKHTTSSKKAPGRNFLSPLVRTPFQSIQKDKPVRKPASPSPSVNRFGFKKPVKRLDSSTIKNKLPNTNLAKIKDQERQILQGVRMNKRFFLQMKMREGKQ
uniref:Uncharacterized protein n=1 Tax=Homalodisca liturata TaxID=320908 RepID=A0A1B6HCK8_9HEMI